MTNPYLMESLARTYLRDYGAPVPAAGRRRAIWRKDRHGSSPGTGKAARGGAPAVAPGPSDGAHRPARTGIRPGGVAA